MFVVDSSIYSSIIVKDQHYEAAVRFLKQYAKNKLITIDFAYIETANVLWKHTYLLKRIPKNTYKTLKASIEPLISNSATTIYTFKELLQEALDNAIDLGITVYDSAYITLAIKNQYKLASFDKQLQQKLKSKNLNIIHIPT